MNSQTEAKPEIVGRLPAIRKCEGCTLCCKIVAVRALGKPAGKWCSHCQAGIGCTIYADRPEECADYECGYLVLPGLGPEWKPSLCRLILSREVSLNRLNVHVDPGRPLAWRKEPYYGRIKRWAEAAMTERGQVIIMLGDRIIAVLPDHETDLGFLADDEMIAIVEMEQIGPGFQYEAYAVKKGTALGAQIAAANEKAITIPADADRTAFRSGRRLD
jgi:hypothetical protein